MENCWHSSPPPCALPQGATLTHFGGWEKKREPDLFIKGLGSEEEAGLQECNKSSVYRQSAVLTDKLCVAGEFGMPSTLSDTVLESPQPAKFWAGPLKSNYHRKKRGTWRVTRPASPLPDLVRETAAAVRSRLLTFRGRFDKDRASERVSSFSALQAPLKWRVTHHLPLPSSTLIAVRACFVRLSLV